MNIDELKKQFIIDKEKYEADKLPELIMKILKYCKVNSDGGIHLIKTDLTIRDKIAVSLISRFLANKLAHNIQEEMTGDEIATILDIDKAQVFARLKDLSDIRILTRTEKSTYKITPFYVESFLDELDAKYFPVESMKEESFASQENTKTKHNKKNKKTSKKVKPEYLDDKFKEDIEKIDKNKHSYIYKMPSVLLRCLAVLDIAVKDLKRDGLTTSEILKILQDRFRFPTTWPSISNSLKRSDQKAYTDSQPIKGHSTARKYMIMHPGEEYLKEEIRKIEKSQE